MSEATVADVNTVHSGSAGCVRRCGTGRIVELVDHQHGWNITHRTREVSALLLDYSTVLIATEGKLTRAHLNSDAIHGFHKPAPG